MTTTIPGMSGLQLAAGQLKKRAQTSAAAMPAGAAKDKILAIIPLADQASALILDAFNTDSNPPPPSTTLQTIIAQSSGNHPACVQGTVGFSWHDGPGAVHGLPAGTAKLTQWAMCNWMANCPDGAELTPAAPTAQIDVRNMKTQVLRNGVWSTVISGVPWGWQENDANYDLAFDNIYDSCGNTCPPPYSLPHGRGKQWYSGQTGVNFAGYQGLVATYEARLLTAGKVMVNAGVDFYGSGGEYKGDARVGKFVELGADWRLVTVTTLTPAQLTATPPPL